MIAGVADTHTAIWYLSDDARLSSAAGAFIDEAARVRHKIAVSSISLAEIVYLVEKKRLPEPAYVDLRQVLSDPEHVFTEAAFTVNVVHAMLQVPRSEVPDLPDRMIAATAVYFAVPAISRDRRIRSAGLTTIW